MQNSGAKGLILYFSANRQRNLFAHNLCKKVKGQSRFTGLFQYLDRLGILHSYPNKFPHSSPEAPRIIQMRETSTSEGGKYSPQFC
jgi:hypothetical protein